MCFLNGTPKGNPYCEEAPFGGRPLSPEPQANSSAHFRCTWNPLGTTTKTSTRKTQSKQQKQTTRCFTTPMDMDMDMEGQRTPSQSNGAAGWAESTACPRTSPAPRAGRSPAPRPAAGPPPDPWPWGEKRRSWWFWGHVVIKLGKWGCFP